MAAVRLGSLTILNGQTESEWFEMPRHGVMRALGIFAPSVLDGTVTVEVADVKSPATADARDLQSGGSDVTVPADGAVTLDALPFAALRLRMSTAALADRVFDLMGHEVLG